MLQQHARHMCQGCLIRVQKRYVDDCLEIIQSSSYTDIGFAEEFYLSGMATESGSKGIEGEHSRMEQARSRFRPVHVGRRSNYVANQEERHLAPVKTTLSVLG